MDVLELGQPVGDDRPDAADDPGDRFAVEIVAEKVLRHPVAADDVVAGRPGDAVQGQVGTANRARSGLEVAEAGDAPGNLEARRQLIGDR